MTIWLRILPYIAAVLLVLGALYGAFHHGVSVTDAKWQAQWAERDTRDATAKAENESAARAREQAYQLSINKVVQDGQRTIDQLTAERASRNGVQLEADKLAARLAASQASGHSCTAATSAAATRAVMVLADVFKRADERAGDLAGYAQDSHARGVTCQKAYESIAP